MFFRGKKQRIGTSSHHAGWRAASPVAAGSTTSHGRRSSHTSLKTTAPAITCKPINILQQSQGRVSSLDLLVLQLDQCCMRLQKIFRSLTCQNIISRVSEVNQSRCFQSETWVAPSVLAVLQRHLIWENRSHNDLLDFAVSTVQGKI